MTHQTTVMAFVHTLRYEAEGIISVELRPQGDTVFTSFEPGAHINLHLPNGLIRSYSLVNSSDEQVHYQVSVLHDRDSRGGSRFMHETLRVGMPLPITLPRNLFPLDEQADHTVLVAGGIGITPIFSMLKRLKKLNKSVELLYCARSRKGAAFIEAIEASGVPVTWHFNDEEGGPVDLRAFLASRSAWDHFYCCGPAPMIDAFEQYCESLGYPNVHVERFSAAIAPQEASHVLSSYEVRLARSEKTLEVPAGKPLLDALLEAGVEVDCSCREGVCGTCETRVISGEPDHRDAVLTKAEKAASKTMMVCVSGCKGASLVLDL